MCEYKKQQQMEICTVSFISNHFILLDARHLRLV